MLNPCIKELGFTFILLLISMSWGLTMGYWSSAQASFEEDFDVGDNATIPARRSLGTVFNLLAPGACIFGGPLINLLIRVTGRKIPAGTIAAVAAASWISLGLTSNLTNPAKYFWLVCLLRCILGISVGATSTVIPMYITELAPSEFRSAFGTLHQFAISTGASMCYALGCIRESGVLLRWGKVAYYSCLPTALNLLLIWLVPESPAVARQEITGPPESLWQLKFVRPFLVSIGLMFFQQFGGTSAFLANLQQIFIDSGSAIEANVAALLVGIAGALASFVGSPLIGIFGRRTMWNISSGAQAFFLALAALQERYKFNTAIPIICLFLDNFTFGIGTAPIPWFFVSELFPDSVRSFAASIITALCWIMGTLLFFVWQAMRDGIGQAGGFGVFAAIMALSLIFGLTSLPDPKPSDMGDRDYGEADRDLSQGLVPIGDV
jgi:MFS family permease